MTTIKRDYSVSEPSLPGVRLIRAAPFRDDRGMNCRLYEKSEFSARNALHLEFLEDAMSTSYRGVLRGIHTETNDCWKLFTCLHGSFFVAVVDCRPDSHFLWEHMELRLNEPCVQLLIPPMIGVGVLCETDVGILHYKRTRPLDSKHQATYHFRNPRFGIQWPMEPTWMSERDSRGMM